MVKMDPDNLSSWQFVYAKSYHKKNELTKCLPDKMSHKIRADKMSSWQNVYQKSMTKCHPDNMSSWQNVCRPKIYQNVFLTLHFHFHFLICLLFPGIPLVKTTKMSKIHNCIFQIQISPWRAALRKKLFWTFLLQISQLKNDQNFTLLRPPLQHFPQKNHKKNQKNYIFFSLVKIWAVLHLLQKEWILFTMKWARNEFLHLWISKMSIDMGKRIVQWISTRSYKSINCPPSKFSTKTAP